MKVTVNKNLNVRVGKPSLNAPDFEYIRPGDQIEVYELLYRGDEYNGIDKWFRDDVGKYYWYGGIDLKTVLPGTIHCINYNTLINLPAEIKETRGNGITVGIVDSGCYKHPSLTNILPGFNALNNSSNVTDKSNISHGTFVTGLIGANDNPGNNSEIIGIAPEVQIIVVKVTEQSSIIDNQALLKGLDWLVNQQVDIINCSFDFSPGGLSNKFNDVFEKAALKKIILVGAGQNNEGLFHDTIFYPAQNINFISVGSVNENVLENNPAKPINSKINYIFQELYFKSTAKYGRFDFAFGSSFSTALTSGAVALVLSYIRREKDFSLSPMDILASFSTELNNSSQLTGYPKIFKNI